MEKTLAEKIYTCPICVAYSKRIGEDMADQFMSLGIEKIIKLKVDETKISSYKSYFYSVLLNVKRDYYNERKHLTLVDEFPEQTGYNYEDQYEDNYKLALKNFLEKDYNDESIAFYQNIIKLSLRMSKNRICQEVGINERKLEKFLDRAKQMIEHEFELAVALY